MTTATKQFTAEIPTQSVVDHRYRVRREIARGGMGIVYEAEHVVLGDVVALKVLAPEAREVFGVEDRLTREARALARARHPGIVAVRDAGTCVRFGRYVALERLEGRPLDGLLISKTKLPLGDVLALAADVGEALTHAHQKGVIHRDIKPANVFIGRRDGGEHAYVLDFGIAFIGDGQKTSTPRLTRAGEVLGTPEYMAPEILIDGLDPSPRSDVFALAAMIYECLTGDVPNPGTAMKIMSALLVDKPFRPIASVRPDVPAFVETVVKRGLSRDPNERPATPAELAAMLHAAVGGPAPVLKLLPTEGNQDGASRRQYARAAYVAPVRLVFDGPASDGRTEDISEGGVLVVGARGPNEGQEIDLRLPLPTSGRVAVVRARAKWVRTRRGAHALGLEFVNLSDDARADVARYVSLMSDAKPAAPAPAIAERPRGVPPPHPGASVRRDRLEAR